VPRSPTDKPRRARQSRRDRRHPGRHLDLAADGRSGLRVAAAMRPILGNHTASGHEKIRVCGQLAPGSRSSFLRSCGH
jgi:hypothetical protein